VVTAHGRAPFSRTDQVDREPGLQGDPSPPEIDIGNATFRAVWDAAGDAMALSDSNGVVLAVNPAYAELYGYSAEELEGHSFAIIFPEGLREWAEEEYRRYFVDTADRQGVEATVRRSDGTERLVDVRYTFVEHDGERVAMLSIIRDVTEQARLKQSEHDLIRQKDNFLLAVSHDLKNPLAAVRGHVQLLLRRLGRDENVNRARLLNGLRQIESTATRMSGMIEGLLDASSMRRGETLPLHRSTFDLASVVRDVVAADGDLSGLHSILVEADTSVVGFWDRDRMQRVVENLLSNAVKYSPEGGQVRMSVVEEEDGRLPQAVLTVSDEGIGIPEGDLPRVFQPFHRGTNVDEGTPGSGIGLAGVRQIVELHGGTITVCSIEGRGSTFTVRLPLESAE
jgi:PAS domain S-box-containing protein